MFAMEECPHCGSPSDGPCNDCLSDHARSAESLAGGDFDPYALPSGEDWAGRGGRTTRAAWSDFSQKRKRQ